MKKYHGFTDTPHHLHDDVWPLDVYVLKKKSLGHTRGNMVFLTLQQKNPTGSVDIVECRQQVFRIL